MFASVLSNTKMRGFRRREALVVDPTNKVAILNGGGTESMFGDPILLQRRVGIDQLTKETHFSTSELKTIYRSFKDTAPNALIHRDLLRSIFSEFFKRGDVEHYADLVFSAINTSQNGFISFPEFVRSLSILCRGTLEERIEWIYRLYDPMRHGFVSWQRVLHVMIAVDDLVEIGRRQNNSPESNVRRAQELFAKFNPDAGGRISKEEFMESCRTDPLFCESVDTLRSVLILK